MNLLLWKFISALNKALLPKIYLKPNLMKLSNLDKAVVGWKMLTTYRYLDAVKESGDKVIP